MAQTAEQIIAGAKGLDGNGMSFVQYLRTVGYKAQSPKTFEKWLLDLFDNNKNGSIGLFEMTAYNRAKKPENIGVYQTQYTQYVTTLKAQDAATVRQYLAIWQANTGNASGASSSRASTETAGENRKTLLVVAAAGVAALLFLK